MKNKKNLISIIIPVYNVENYIDNSINDILNQTYDNFELIIVNDGSKDRTLSKIEKYNDCRIKLYNQINKGVSSARNIGLDNANGKYIIFLDADDRYEKNMIETLYKDIIRRNYDMSICNFFIEKENKVIKNKISYKYDTISSNKKFKDLLLESNSYGGYLWNKLIKKSIIENVRFREDIHIMEDLIFLIEISNKIDNVYIDSNEYLYHYIKRNNSALNTINEKYITALNAYTIILNYIKDSNYYNKYCFNYLYTYMNIYSYISKNKKNEKEKEKYKNELKTLKSNYLKFALKDTDHKSIDKIKLLIKMYSRFLY